MIDTLQHHLQKADSSTVKSDLAIEQPYNLVTLHRPSNVDSPETLLPLFECLRTISQQQKLIFPIHPRTKNNAEKFGLLKMLEDNTDISLTSPLGYLDFLHLIQNAAIVITDSGGIQEETTVLNVPCITLRENTERPVTVTQGSNYLIGTNPGEILSTVNLILSGKGKQAVIPKYWDGRAGERIVNILVSQ